MVGCEFFYGGMVENTRKMVIARHALDTITWSNESTFKFNDYVTQLIIHCKTLERGEEARTDEEKVIMTKYYRGTAKVLLK